MSETTVTPLPDLEKVLKILASPSEVFQDEVVDSFCMSCLYSQTPIPINAARAVLERRDITASDLLEISDRFFHIAAIKTSPNELPKTGSTVASFLIIALLARSFAHQVSDPELHSEPLSSVSAPKGFLDNLP